VLDEPPAIFSANVCGGAVSIVGRTIAASCLRLVCQGDDARTGSNRLCKGPVASGASLLDGAERLGIGDPASGRGQLAIERKSHQPRSCEGRREPSCAIWIEPEAPVIRGIPDNEYARHPSHLARSTPARISSLPTRAAGPG
jgi:hypothetical protein